MTDRQTGRSHSICDEYQHQTGNQYYVDSKSLVRDSIWHLKGVKKLLGGKYLQLIGKYSVRKQKYFPHFLCFISSFDSFVNPIQWKTSKMSIMIRSKRNLQTDEFGAKSPEFFY